MVFDIEDAQNDGKIKREAGGQMVKTARNSSPQLFEALMEICESTGQEPRNVLGDILVRALNDEDYSQVILGTEINMQKLQANQIRQEDLQFVKQIAEEFDLNPDESDDPVEKLIERRLEAVAGTDKKPFDFMKQEAQQGGGESNAEVAQLKQEVAQLKAELRAQANAESEEEAKQRAEQERKNRKTIDELLEVDEPEEPEPEPEEQSEEDTEQSEVEPEGDMDVEVTGSSMQDQVDELFDDDDEEEEDEDDGEPAAPEIEGDVPEEDEDEGEEKDE